MTNDDNTQDQREGILCEECGAGPFYSFAEVGRHTTSDAHIQMNAIETRKQREGQENDTSATVAASDLSPDLKSIALAFGDSPQDRAKALRGAFSARGWPNGEHPGSVRDFLNQWGIPIAQDNARIRQEPWVREAKDAITAGR